jgi:hypothetical protein
MERDLLTIWRTHRGQLHNPAVWSIKDGDDKISLTYVPTGAGFTGVNQLYRFATLYPAEQHPFANLTRFNNAFEIVSSSIDIERRIVTEEIVISSLHQYRLDYLMPGLASTHLTFALPVIIVAAYGLDSLLQEVRIYWDQASLLKQLGVFPLAFHNLIRSAGNSITFDNELDKLPIIDGMRISRRLVHPTLQNCNLIVSLDALEAAAAATATNKNSTVKFSPIGGLDNITELAKELPELNPKQIHEARNLPHYRSSIFNQADHPSSSSSSNHVESRHVSGMASTLKFGDGSSEPIHHHPIAFQATRSVFSDDSEPIRPSITVDPHRNDSSVFAEPQGPFQPSIPLMETARFTSNLFNADPSKVDEQRTYRKPDPVQLKSHIFDPEPVEIQTKIIPASTRPFGNDDKELPVQQVRAMNNTNSGSFHGSGFSFTNDTLPSFSGRHGDPRSNRSTIFAEVEVPRVLVNANNRNVNNRNASSLNLGDEESGVTTVRPSSRVLQPPGGHSTIFQD